MVVDCRWTRFNVLAGWLVGVLIASFVLEFLGREKIAYILVGQGRTGVLYIVVGKGGVVRLQGGAAPQMKVKSREKTKKC